MYTRKVYVSGGAKTPKINGESTDGIVSIASCIARCGWVKPEGVRIEN
jgi:hypothetical protein